MLLISPQFFPQHILFITGFCVSYMSKQVKLSECRRVLLFSFNAETEYVEMRHYVINASPVGLTRSVKKIIKANIPDLNKFTDISDYVLKYTVKLC